MIRIHLFTRNLFLLLILGICYLDVAAQSQSPLPPPPDGPPTHEDYVIAEKASRCKHRDLYSLAERRAFYPFKEAASIRLISFDDPELDVNQLPVKNGRVDNSQVRESHTLSQKQIDRLTDVLYNIGRAKENAQLYVADTGFSCYNPRNAILFLDDKEHVFAYLEICFECGHMNPSDERIKEGCDCLGRIELLRKYFSHQGMKVGTKKH